MVCISHVTALVSVFVVASTVSAGSSLTPQPSEPRVVAIGDIHGSAEGLNAILRAARLVDDTGRWIGGPALLVQTGDYTDRGERVRDVLDVLMRLEDEAKRGGGRAEILLGNHEAMNLLLDLRDVAPRAYATFADAESEERRRRAYRDYVDVVTRRGVEPLPEGSWNEQHPLGFVEYVDALGPEGPYGRWLRARKVVVKEHGTIFMHAGLPETTTESLDDVNRTVAREIEEWDSTRDLLVRTKVITPYFTLQETLDAIVAELKRIAKALQAKEPLEDYVTREYAAALQNAARIGQSPLFSDNGPLWFRGFALWPDSDGAKVTSLLERYDAVRFVTGHTPVVQGITARFDNRVFLIDTGMLTSYYSGGEPSALELQGETVTAIYPDRRETLATAAVAR